jgi:hypothetical protein
MFPKDISNRLREHSGLPVATPQLDGLAFVDRVQAIKKGEIENGIEEAVTDVIDCLHRLNHYNQRAPETRGEILNTDVVYAISGMTLYAIEVAMALCKTGKSCSKLLNAVWKIGCAWDALLAGDIEDIPKHLGYEAAARNVD